MKPHQLCSAFPAMSDEDFAILSKDIATNGQLEPITIFEGAILDGWHRYQACAELNIAPKTQGFTGDDPAAFVLSKNLHRRHLNASQRAVAVTACREWMPKGRQNQMGTSAHLISTEDLAREASVSPRTIKYAKVAIKAGRTDEVVAGKTSVKKVAAEVRGKPTEKPKPMPAPEPKIEEGNGIDLTSEFKAVCEENQKLQELNESLMKDDTKREIAVWRDKFDAACGRINQLTTTNNEMRKQLEYQAKLFANIRKELRVEKNSEILSALKEVMSK